VAKKEKHCAPDKPADDERGDRWDHVAFDPEHRLVLDVIPGPRTAENVNELVGNVKRRTDEKKLDLITTDEYKPYKQAILEVYGEKVTPPRTGKPGRPKSAYFLAPTDLNYATVHKTRRKGRVVKVEQRVVFGNEPRVHQALNKSSVSNVVNTSFIERHNGTDRHRNARKSRKTYRFSKRRDMHDAMTYYTMYSYNFCWPVRTLSVKDARDRHHPRTPAMAAGLTDHPWPLTEWLTHPAIQRE
jgi:IS1 family transposase